MEGVEDLSPGETLRRFGEVAKLFLDAGHVIISTSNVFNQEDHSDVSLLIEPCPLIEIHITDGKVPQEADFSLTLEEAKYENDAVDRILDYLKKQKIQTGHNYSI